MLLFLVWRRNSGISFSRAFQIPFHEPPEQILGATKLVDNAALASFIGSCQFKYGGIAKAPGEHAGRASTPLSQRFMTNNTFQTHITRISLSRQSLCFHRLQQGEHGPSSPWIL